MEDAVVNEPRRPRSVKTWIWVVTFFVALFSFAGYHIVGTAMKAPAITLDGGKTRTFEYQYGGYTVTTRSEIVPDNDVRGDMEKEMARLGIPLMSGLEWPKREEVYVVRCRYIDGGWRYDADFETDIPVSDVLAFYTKALPGGISTPGPMGDTTWRFADGTELRMYESGVMASGTRRYIRMAIERPSYALPKSNLASTARP
ncbi:MAG: hypothetical protein KF784_03135 [Fimbriimonadaceae bacterium]|nr:hypothetical protein [Fimbriimonadaceae bacterium]